MEHIITHTNPEVKIRVAKFSCTNQKFSKRNIILIPGWLSAIDNFTELAKELQSFSNIIIYEPRGFGESHTPHKKGLFSVEKYNEELKIVIDHLKLKNEDFIMLGSCAGAAMAFSYILDRKGSKPKVLIVFSPQEQYKTPFWLPVLGWIPTFFMSFIQKLIIVFYKLYLKIRGKKESENVNWAEDRLKKNDAWSLRRYVLEFIVSYGIIGRQKEMDIPMLIFVAKKDHFVGPEISKEFAHHPDSEIFQVDISMHRIQEGNEKLIAEEVNKYLTKMKM
ncbi:MAG: alpha/beta fold hydrolase [Candidatus Heimdallarchaeota archaeon]|nr:alpha/beta fold hydrolase [Candidatus Heimdallarchaeota archaeon]